MDKKVLEDMGFELTDNKILTVYEYKTRDFIIRTDGLGFQLIADVCGSCLSYPLTINNKFELEQLLKILGE